MKAGKALLLVTAGIVMAAAGGKRVYAEENAGFGNASVTLDGMVLNQASAGSAKARIDALEVQRLDRRVHLEAAGRSWDYTAGELGLTWTNPEISDMIASLLEDPMFGHSGLQLSFASRFDVNPDTLHGVLDSLIAEISSAPVNGTVYKDGDHIAVTEGKDGITARKEDFFPQLADQLLSGCDSFAIPCEITHPAISPATVSFSPQPLGEYTTYGLGVPGRVHNIERSSSGIDGTLVMPGDSFSALTMYGAVTAENGYEIAPVYNSGSQIPGIGGGVCQTTTTLYNACLRAELQIVLRRQHSMLVSYVPPSWDAMVDYGTHSDFIAANNTGYPIYLEASTGIDGDGDSYVNVRIWGTETRPANRQIEFSFEVLACKFPSTLFKVNAVNDDVTTYGLAMPNEKIYAEVESHPFVQSRAFKTVYIDGQPVSREQLPATYGPYDQYKEMPGTIYHASDCRVTYWVVSDPNTWLGSRVHYEVQFLNGKSWDPNNPNGYY